jgi:putative ABC transport system permease protein
MSFFASWRTALRVARREARRSKGRSMLVIAMIAMPVLALSFAAVTYDMFNLTPTEAADRLMGTGTARVLWEVNGPIQQSYSGEYYGSDQVNVDPGKSGSGDGKPFAPSTADVVAKFPSGTRAVALRRGTADFTTALGTGSINAISIDAADPLTHGYVTVLSGRAPATTGEVALTREAVDRLGAGVGATVKLADGSASYTVVGLVEFPSRLVETVLFAPGGEPDNKHAGQLDREWLVATPGPVAWSDVLQLNMVGIRVFSREVLRNPPAAPDPYGTVDAGIRTMDTPQLSERVLVFGLAILEIILLAGPAFAVSARRRQRQLALVAANGGTGAHVRRIVLADGVVLGFAGALVGIALGILAAFLGRPLVEHLYAHVRAGGYRVFPLALLGITLFAIGTGLLAATVPAFTTARQNVVQALLGRRGVTRSRKRWIAVGAAMIVSGTAIVVAGTYQVSASIILVGLILGELGITLCTPAIVGLVARVGRVLPVAPRVALRDAARNRAAAAPAISAVMAAVAGSVAIGLFLGSQATRNNKMYELQLPIGYASVYIGDGNHTQAQLDELTSAVEAVLPVTGVAPLVNVACPPSLGDHGSCALRALIPPDRACPYKVNGNLTKADVAAAARDPRCSNGGLAAMGYGKTAVADDGTNLSVLTGVTGPDIKAAAATLRSGGVVVSDPSLVENGHVTMAIFKIDLNEVKNNDNAVVTPFSDPLASAPKVSLPAYVLAGAVGRAQVIVSPGEAQQLGFAIATESLVFATERMPTTAETDQFNFVLQSRQLGGFVEPGPPNSAATIALILAAASALITIGAAGIATGLAAADSRADMSALAAVGASPRLRRGLSLSQSGVIAGLGSLLGALAGGGAAIAILFALNQRYAGTWPAPPAYSLTVPWLSLIIAVLIVPGIAMLGAGLLTRSRLPIERRTG